MDFKYIMKLVFAILSFGVAIVSIEYELMTISNGMSYSKVKINDYEFRAEFYSQEQLENREYYSDECRAILKHVEKDVSYFPVAEASVDKASNTSFVNTWMSERNFGGKRGHEGTDIMASKNQRGLYPVVSMTDGTVTNKGWLEKGDTE